MISWLQGEQKRLERSGEKYGANWWKVTSAIGVLLNDEFVADFVEVPSSIKSKPGINWLPIGETIISNNEYDKQLHNL